MDSIFILLSKFKFEIKGDIPNNFKCIKCQNVLNNAKQIECGCRFCSNCVQDLIERGCECCPGITTICKKASLSRAIPDYATNRDISNIIVQCPLQCGLEDKLINLDGHLQICSKKNLQCIFSRLGCAEGNMLGENIKTHLQSECHNHMMMMVNTIEFMENENKNTKTEMKDIKKENENVMNQNKYIKMEMENVKKDNENMRTKVENIEKLNEKMKRDLKNTRIENENIKTKIENIEKQNEKMKRDLKSLRIENENIKAKIESIEGQNGIMKIENENMKEKIGNIESLNKIMKNENENMKIQIEDMENQNDNMKNETQKLERQIESINNEIKLTKMGGRLEWKIDKMEDRIKNKENLQSKYFYSKINSYKMSLEMYTNSNANLVIGFGIWDDVRNGYYHKWPFQATVTMKIKSKEEEKSQTQNIKLVKPTNNSYKFYEFRFDYFDLIAANLVVNDCMTVECIVDDY